MKGSDSLTLRDETTTMKIFSYILLIFCTYDTVARESAFDNKVAIISSIDTAPLNAQQIRNLFSLKKKLLPNNLRAELIRLPLDHHASKLLCQNLYQLYPYQIQRQWDRRIFSGKAIAPKQAITESEVVQMVRTRKNSLGYISANSPLLIEYKGQFNVIAVY